MPLNQQERDDLRAKSVAVTAAIDALVPDEPPNIPPSVTLAVDPATGEASPEAPLAVTLSASAADVDGTLQKVTFFRNGTLVAEDVTAPFEFTDTVSYPGDYVYTALAEDDDGASTMSGEVLVRAVVPLRPPSITGMTATPSSLPFGGGSVVVDAVVIDADTLTLDGFPVTLPATVQVDSSKSLVLVATNAKGSVSASASVVVEAAPPLPGASIIKLEDTGSGISRDFSFYALALKWRKPLEGALLGTSAKFSVAGPVSVPLSDLPAGGIVVKMLPNGSLWPTANVCSREHATVASRPVVRVTYADGTDGTLACTLDAAINTSMSAPSGLATYYPISNASIVVMQFAAPSKPVASAALVLTPFGTVYSAPAQLQVFALTPQFMPEDSTVKLGLRAANRLNAASVIEVADLTGDRLAFRRKWWNRQSALPTDDAVWWPDRDGDTGELFARGPRMGTQIETDGLTVNAWTAATAPAGWSGPPPKKTIPIGDAASFYFLDQVGRELDEVYFSYCLRFGAGWHASTRTDPVTGKTHYLQNGKLPGIASDTAVNSGATSNGRNGWSLRGGHYAGPFDSRSPYGSNHGRIPVGIYGYTYDQQLTVPISTYGLDYIAAGNGEVGILDVGRDYWIDWRVKVNEPGVPNGEVDLWIDGKRAYQRRDWILRLAPPYQVAGNLGIGRIWMSLLIGGAVGSIPKVTRTYFSDMVIASEYIGPE